MMESVLAHMHMLYSRKSGGRGGEERSHALLYSHMLLCTQHQLYQSDSDLEAASNTNGCFDILVHEYWYLNSHIYSGPQRLESGHSLTTIWSKLTFDPQQFDLNYNVAYMHSSLILLTMYMHSSLILITMYMHSSLILITMYMYSSLILHVHQ